MWEPFGTLPANSSAYWQPAPSERGTFGVLSTCILTLLLCVYTCLHPNIPPEKVTKWYQNQWAVKALGILVGLLAPELVAYLAFRQWLWARNLEVYMKERIDKLITETTESKRSIWSRLFQIRVISPAPKHNPLDDDPEAASRMKHQKKNRWTRTHSHFALMGGFAFQADETQTMFMPAPYTRLTLTPSALRKLAEVEPMLIPDISDSDIGDKSKANWLAKTLVCLQASWFIVQVIGRTATSAPISLLEMNTFLHALCCLVVYLAWWSKPLDIGTPELIKTDTEPNRKICAWLIMNSRLGAVRFLGLLKVHSCYVVHGKDMYKTGTSKMISDMFIDPSTNRSDEPSSVDHARADETLPDARRTPTIRPSQMVNGFYFIGRKYNTYPPAIRFSLNSETLECLRLADLLRTESDAGDIWKFDWSRPMSAPSNTRMVIPFITDFYEFDDDVALDGFKGSSPLSIRLKAKYVFWAILLASGSIYGLVHLIAWNGPFASLPQRWMWRAACFAVVSPAIMVAVLYPCYKLYRKVKYKTWAIKFDRCIISPFSRNGFYPAAGLGIIFSLIYLAARMFLLVECFINISELPPEVYQMPQWSQYIPHLGTG